MRTTHSLGFRTTTVGSLKRHSRVSVTLGVALAVLSCSGETPLASAPRTDIVNVVLSPKSVTLKPGDTERFAVAGLWSDGSTQTPAATYSATGGTITSAGVYTAGSVPGAYTVI